MSQEGGIEVQSVPATADSIVAPDSAVEGDLPEVGSAEILTIALIWLFLYAWFDEEHGG